MVLGTLYNIENYNDFFDSLSIMETMKDKSFKLIFMELPRLLHSTMQIYETTDCWHEQNIHPTFVSNCFENAARLLTDNGILVVFAPHTTYSNQNYNLPLNQLFPSVIDIIYNVEMGQNTIVSKLFFCSKQERYEFPHGYELRSSEHYEYEDENGVYRLISPFTTLINHPGFFYTWKTFSPKENETWRYKEDKLNELWLSNKIIIKDNCVYLKRYRTEEPISLPPLWKRPFLTLGNIYNCDPITITRILSMYCTKNDSVFCPFEYDCCFVTAAHDYGIKWTAIKLHIINADRYYSKIPAESYTTVSQLPRPKNALAYRDDIILKVKDLENLKSQIKDLTLPQIELGLWSNAKTTDSVHNIDKIATGTNLYNLRMSHNLSVKDVADFFGSAVSETTIYNWESGKHLPRLDRLIQLALLYKVKSLHNLVVLSEPKNNK